MPNFIIFYHGTCQRRCRLTNLLKVRSVDDVISANIQRNEGYFRTAREYIPKCFGIEGGVLATVAALLALAYALFRYRASRYRFFEEAGKEG